MKTFMSSLLLTVLIAINVHTQTKLVITDNFGVLNPQTDSLLEASLSTKGIEYATTVDFRNKCKYNFAELGVLDKVSFIEIKDCKDKLIGYKELGAAITDLPDNSKVVIIDYAISDILNNPGLYLPREAKIVQNNPAPATSPANIQPVQQNLPATRNEHSSRHFFTPTAYNLKKGELYYNTLYFLSHDAQYGISDKFSLGVGTTIGGFPFYLTPKATLYSKGNTTIGVGDMLMIGTYGINFTGNIAYGIITLGNEHSNASFAVGHLHISSDDNPITNKLLGNFSFMHKLSPYFYLLSENYLTSFTVNEYYWNENTGESGTFERNNVIFAGISGVRFINKKKDVQSFQIGLTYLSIIPDEAPAHLRESVSDGLPLLAFPTVSFTHKFGQRY